MLDLIARLILRLSALLMPTEPPPRPVPVPVRGRRPRRPDAP